MTKLPLIALAMLAIAGSACQRYQRRPVDLAVHRGTFLARLPDSPEVAAFAERLASEGRAVPGGFNPADGLTIAEAEAVALIFNADLRTARLRAGVAKAGSEQAGRWEDPVLSVDLERIVESVPNPWTISGTVGLTIPISGRLAIEKKRAGAEHAAALAALVEQEWTTRMELRRAWALWSSLDAQVATMTPFITQMDQATAIIEAHERAGEVARNEARLLRIETATRKSNLRKQQDALAAAELTLKRTIGLAPTAAVKLVPGGLPGGSSAADLTELRNRAESDNLTIASAKARYEIAERTLELEIRRQYPDITIGPGLEKDQGFDKVLLGLSLPIPILNANRRAIAEAVASREAARAELEAALEHLLADLALAERAIQSAAAQRRTMETEIIPLVDAQYEDTRRVAQLGELSTMVLLETLSRQHDAKVNLIDSHLADVRALIRLQELAGPAQPGVSP